ncbi:hypothetical protein EDD85DRAFT_793350 [Armillaria nabsnona]|nr:hypothetical protein EDD85DRAFT_793350 [Armillaria nabsnona]
MQRPLSSYGLSASFRNCVQLIFSALIQATLPSSPSSLPATSSHAVFLGIDVLVQWQWNLATIQPHGLKRVLENQMSSGVAYYNHGVLNTSTSVQIETLKESTTLPSSDPGSIARLLESVKLLHRARKERHYPLLRFGDGLVMVPTSRTWTLRRSFRLLGRLKPPYRLSKVFFAFLSWDNDRYPLNTAKQASHPRIRRRLPFKEKKRDVSGSRNRHDVFFSLGSMSSNRQNQPHEYPVGRERGGREQKSIGRYSGEWEPRQVRLTMHDHEWEDLPSSTSVYLWNEEITTVAAVPFPWNEHFRTLNHNFLFSGFILASLEIFDSAPISSMQSSLSLNIWNHDYAKTMAAPGWFATRRNEEWVWGKALPFLLIVTNMSSPHQDFRGDFRIEQDGTQGMWRGGYPRAPPGSRNSTWLPSAQPAASKKDEVPTLPSMNSAWVSLSSVAGANDRVPSASLKTETLGLFVTLKADPMIILLFLAFFVLKWFYTWQFSGFNGAVFNICARGLLNLPNHRVRFHWSP